MRSRIRSRPSSAWPGSGRADDLRQAPPLEYLEFVAGLWGIEARDAGRARTTSSAGSGSAAGAPALRRILQGHAPEGGARRRAGARSELIILDEPLTGLDAGSARQVKIVLRERVAAGGTVIMTTHILEVAERMADRIGVIAGGKLIAQGTLDELRGRPARRRRAWRTRSWRWSPNRRGGVSHPGTVVWFARHELRLAWRDWLAMMTAGGRWRKHGGARRHRVPVAMHLLAVSMVGRFAEHRAEPDKGTLVAVTGCASCRGR